MLFCIIKAEEITFYYGDNIERNNNEKIVPTFIRNSKLYILVE